MTYQPDKWKLPRVRRRSTRWYLLFGICFAIAVTGASLIIPGNPHRSAPLVPMIWLPAVIAANSSPFTLNAFLVRRGFERFDEFERAALYEAIRRSYLIVILLLAGATFWLFGAVTFDLPLPTQARHWEAIGYAAFICIAALPVTFAEFTVPMPEREDGPM